MGKFIMIGAAVMLSMSGPATARKPASTSTPAQIQRLMACRTLTESAARLTCFDREAAAMEQAVARRDLVFIDRERATEARRSLFGFSVPSFGGLFGGGEDDEVKQIDGVVVSAGRNADGGWVIRLGDNSTWSQTDDTPLALAPKPGQKVIVRRGALGTFRLSVNGQPGLKVKRVG